MFIAISDFGTRKRKLLQAWHFWFKFPHPTHVKVKFPTPQAQEVVKCLGFARGGGDVEVSIWSVHKPHLTLTFIALCVLLLFQANVRDVYATLTGPDGKELKWNLSMRCISYNEYMSVYETKNSKAWYVKFWITKLCICIRQTVAFMCQ